MELTSLLTGVSRMSSNSFRDSDKDIVDEAVTSCEGSSRTSMARCHSFAAKKHFPAKNRNAKREEEEEAVEEEAEGICSVRL